MMKVMVMVGACFPARGAVFIPAHILIYPRPCFARGGTFHGPAPMFHARTVYVRHVLAGSISLNFTSLARINLSVHFTQMSRPCGCFADGFS